jgi:hypothetical protein
MIKLKDILLESTAPDIFIPRRIEDRFERMISLYVRNGSKGDLDLSGLNLNELPEILKNVSVGGSFFCGNNNLTSLKNAPNSVGRTFGCSSNSLNSLTGAPTSVGGDFYCVKNFLTSLRGAPKTVGGDFVCHSNLGIFTKEQVRAVCDVKGKIIV